MARRCLPIFRALLEHGDVRVRSATGRCLALLYSIILKKDRGDDDAEDDEDDEEDSEEEASGSGRGAGGPGSEGDAGEGPVGSESAADDDDEGDDDDDDDGDGDRGVGSGEGYKSEDDGVGGSGDDEGGEGWSWRAVAGVAPGPDAGPDADVIHAPYDRCAWVTWRCVGNAGGGRVGRSHAFRGARTVRWLPVVCVQPTGDCAHWGPSVCGCVAACVAVCVCMCVRVCTVLLLRP